ncbi:unnamed protein product, partial [Nippostrongylus brasiliensis]|uniref:Fes1 domain-containing protein n=1 Tax=Nippostrongylus brasiliensis TaxID=27835 RepID=A0A0N4XSS8_NIPBR
MLLLFFMKPPHEHKLLCWILNRISDDLANKEFKDELGTMLGLLEDICYDGEDDSREYLSSVVRITSTLITNNLSMHQLRDNESMLTEIRERLIRRLYKQILDCIQQEHGSSPLDV